MTQPADDFNWHIDATRCYETAIAAKREMGIRSGAITPRDAREREWANQGPVPVEELETGR